MFHTNFNFSKMRIKHLWVYDNQEVFSWRKRSHKNQCVLYAMVLIAMETLLKIWFGSWAISLKQVKQLDNKHLLHDWSLETTPFLRWVVFVFTIHWCPSWAKANVCFYRVILRMTIRFTNWVGQYLLAGSSSQDGDTNTNGIGNYQMENDDKNPFEYCQTI